MKKESYRHNLPHFQQPGQSYFVTWILKNSIPKKALIKYTVELQMLKNKLVFFEEQRKDKKQILTLKNQYRLLREKYLKSYDDLLAAQKTDGINLTKPENLQIIIEALNFWENKKLKTYAYSVMPNHVHWVLNIYETDVEGNLVYLQDILQSVKRYTANQINKMEGRSGSLWQKETFDTTIRNEQHLINVVEYTLNNPVSAGLVKERNNWPGNFLCKDFY